jgi:predicted TIM-barrel fold metal-dependent hydrolase
MNMQAGRIDVHAHYIGGAFGRWLIASGFLPAGADPDAVSVPVWSPELAGEFMDAHGIATQVLSIPIFLSSRGDPESASSFAREINEDFAALIAEHPDRFGAFAAVPLGRPDEALTEIAYALDELKLDGVHLPSNVGGQYFGQPFYEPILAELSRRQVPVFVHPDEPPHADELACGRVSAIVEYPMDTARTINNGIYKGVFQRCPGLRLILAHGGGVLPTLGWRIAALLDLRGADDAAITADHVADVLRNLRYDTALAASSNSLYPILDVTGHDHVLFGTDYPAAPVGAIDRNIENLTAFDRLTAGERADIEWGNAAALFPRLRRDLASSPV